MRQAARTAVVLCLFAGVAPVGDAQATKDPQQLEQSCNAGDPKACVDLGDFYRNRAILDSKAAGDMTRAVQLFQKACDGQSGAGCARLGDAYKLGEGVDRDPTRASLAYERACDMGAGSIIDNSCSMVARIHDPKDGDLKDAKRWATFLEKACNAGEGEDCLRIGLAYDLGMWVTKSATHAIELFKKGCFFGNKEACNLVRK